MLLSGWRNILVKKLSLTIMAMVGTAFSAAADEPTLVTQLKRQFQPGEVTIARGESVSIRNEDPFFHHLYVASDKFEFSSDEQRPDEVVEIRFPTPGEYDVQCRIHLKMKLHVTVQ